MYILYLRFAADTVSDAITALTNRSCWQPQGGAGSVELPYPTPLIPNLLLQHNPFVYHTLDAFPLLSRRRNALEPCVLWEQRCGIISLGIWTRRAWTRYASQLSIGLRVKHQSSIALAFSYSLRTSTPLKTSSKVV